MGSDRMGAANGIRTEMDHEVVVNAMNQLTDSSFATSRTKLTPTSTKCRIVAL